MTLTNEQYINGLPHNGLELAEEYLLDDLATLQENDLPTSDTVDSLVRVHTRLTDVDEEDEEDTSDDA
jgi:hypothetical protein